MDPYSRAFRILNCPNNEPTAKLIQPTCLTVRDDMSHDSDESTTYLELQPFVDSPNVTTGMMLIIYSIVIMYDGVSRTLITRVKCVGSRISKMWGVVTP